LQNVLLTLEIEPTTFNEKEVADFLQVLWSFVLETPEIPLDVSFFDLGGRSLQMMVVINHLRTRFGLEISPLAFALAPTIQALARHCCAPEDTEDYL
jgi:acyl carrier protein